MRVRIAAVALLLGIAGLLRAQETSWISRTTQAVSRKLTTPSRIFDTTYVFQLSKPWLVSLNGDLIWSGVTLDSDITFAAEGDKLRLSKQLGNNYFKKVGAGVAYGSLQFSYTLEVARSKTQPNRYFNISFVRPSFGVSVQYYDLHEYLNGQLSSAWLDEPIELASSAPGHMRQVIIDGFYFFNPSHFSYKAVTGRQLIQRRSAGSWMALARYMQEEYRDDLNEQSLDLWFDYIGHYRIHAFSLGAGYSFNWVPLHRNAVEVGRPLQGLRNLTFNATLVPYVSLFNSVATAQHHQAGTPEATEGPLVPSHKAFLPTFNVTARAGICFSWNHFVLSAVVVGDRYTFRNLQAVSDGFETTNSGLFYDLTTQMAFGYRF